MERTYRLTFFDHEGSRVVLERSFNDSYTIAARAHDWAYGKAGKGAFTVQEVDSDSGLDADYDAKGAPF